MTQGKAGSALLGSAAESKSHGNQTAAMPEDCRGKDVTWAPFLSAGALLSAQPRSGGSVQTLLSASKARIFGQRHSAANRIFTRKQVARSDPSRERRIVISMCRVHRHGAKLTQVP